MRGMFLLACPLWAIAVACGSSGGGGASAQDGGGADGSSGGGGGSGSSSSSGGSSGSGSGGAPDGGGGSSSGGTSCEGGACNSAPPGLLNPDYTTTWNPGILADTPTGNPLGPDRVPVRTTTCASVPVSSGDATSAIQSALTGCAGKNQVVTLAAGTYRISSTLSVPSGVVLRGAGSDAMAGTIVVRTNGGPVLSIGTLKDTVCYNGSGFDASAQPLLTQDATKETSAVAVASASHFAVGDLALVDQTDNSEVSEGDCGSIFKRAANYGVSQRVAVSAVSGNTLTLATPLHWTFKTAQRRRSRGSPRRPRYGRGSRASSCRGAARGRTRARTRAESTSRTRRTAG